MKMILLFAVGLLAWSAPALAVPPEVQAELGRLGGKLKDAHASLDKTVDAARVHTRQSGAAEPSREDNGKIIDALGGLKASVQALADFMHAHEADLRPEDAKFDSHLGAFQDQVKDLDSQIADAKLHHYFKRMQRKGTGVETR